MDGSSEMKSIANQSEPRGRAFSAGKWVMKRSALSVICIESYGRARVEACSERCAYAGVGACALKRWKGGGVLHR